MTLKTGNYETRFGQRARVRRMRRFVVEGSLPTWVFDGAIEIDGAWCQTSWRLDGSNMSGASFDILLSADEEQRSVPPDNVVRFPKIFRAVNTISFGGVQ